MNLNKLQINSLQYQLVLNIEELILFQVYFIYLKILIESPYEKTVWRNEINKIKFKTIEDIQGDDSKFNFLINQSRILPRKLLYSTQKKNYFHMLRTQIFQEIYRISGIFFSTWKKLNQKKFKNCKKYKNYFYFIF